MNKIDSLSELQTGTIDPIRQKIVELAALDPVDYAMQRKEAAKALNIGVTILDGLVKSLRNKEKAKADDTSQLAEWMIEPFPEPVEGETLFDELHEVISRYVIADNSSIEAASMWIALTWFADVATVLPMAMITAPEKGCGKTVFLSVIEKLSCRPLQCSNISAPAMFRTVETYKPTLLIDEADSFLRENEPIRGVLNSGHTKSSAYVIRCEEVDGVIKPVRFSTYCPKAIAGIRLDTLHATLTSRSITLPLRRKKPTETTENLRHAPAEQFEVLQRKLLRWSADHAIDFAQARPIMGGLSNRDADNWEPLFVIAQLAGGTWPEKIRLAALQIVGGAEDSPSLEQELLAGIKSSFDRRKVAKLATSTLIEDLTGDELAPWATFNHGFPIRPRQLASRLKSYGIAPKTLRAGAVTFKGYELADFADTFDRFLVFSADTPDLSVTRSHPADNAENRDNTSVTEAAPVTDSEALRPALDQACVVVTDKTGLIEEKKDSEIVEVIL